MRLGRVLLVLAWVGTAAFGAAQPSIERAAHARQMFESGVTLERLGQYQQAIDALTQAINAHALKGEDAARAVFDRGVAFDALGDPRRAVADYSAAIRLSPCLAAALSNRGNAFRRAGKLTEAKRDYFGALNCPGGDRQYPYYGLGQIAEKLGDSDTARDYYQRAVAVDPGFALAAHSLTMLRRPTPALPAEHQQALRQPARVHHALTDLVPNQKAQPLLRRAISDAAERDRVQIQLGAFREEQQAAAAWPQIMARAGGALDGLRPIIVSADLPGRGRFWRLRAAVSNSNAAKNLCATLEGRKQACMLVRN